MVLWAGVELWLYEQEWDYGSMSRSGTMVLWAGVGLWFYGQEWDYGSMGRSGTMVLWALGSMGRSGTMVLWAGVGDYVIVDNIFEAKMTEKFVYLVT